MDELELLTAVDKAKGDSKFEDFLKEMKLAPDHFGADMIEDLTRFHEWLGDPKRAAGSALAAPEPATPAPPATTEAAAPAHPPTTTEPAAPAHAPSSSEPLTPDLKEAQPDVPATPPPPRQTGDSSVEAALKRLQTVDLKDGCRPPQTLAQLGNPAVPDLTVVIMKLNGIDQPVSLPLTPQQCLAAGLQLANPPHGDEQKPDGAGASTAEDDVDGDTVEDDAHEKALDWDEMIMMMVWWVVQPTWASAWFFFAAGNE